MNPYENNKEMEGNKRGGELEKNTVNEQDGDINWNQVVYHSLQVWKERNNINATFYSLIGVFQHSSMLQTAGTSIRLKKRSMIHLETKNKRAMPTMTKPIKKRRKY